jgi:hypothetical protein
VALCDHDIVGDDPRPPLDLHLCGRLGYRGGGLALVSVRLCRPRFEALNAKAMTANHSRQRRPFQTIRLWPSIVVLSCIAIVAAGALALIGWIALALLGY